MTFRDAAYDRLRRQPQIRGAVRELKRGRRRLWERIGSDRYSHPSELDALIAPYLPQRPGVFVEAGAFDGYWQSTTYWLERFGGWTGVLVEPVAEYAAEARRNRPRSRVFQCALAAEDGAPITMTVGGTMSLVSGARRSEVAERRHAVEGVTLEGRDAYEITVPTRTLSGILDEARVDHVDLLSLDVEGYEATALRGLDLARHAPALMLVEMLDEERERGEIEAILGARYEWVGQLSARDHLYRAT